MLTEYVDELRKRYTDREVLVVASRPEMARLDGKPGRVMTINAAGRALVQFEGVDRAWYEVDLKDLRQVEKNDSQ